MNDYEDWSKVTLPLALIAGLGIWLFTPLDNYYEKNRWEQLKECFPYAIEDGHYHLEQFSNASGQGKIFSYVDVKDGVLQFDGLEMFRVERPPLSEVFPIGPSCFGKSITLYP